MRDRVRRKKKPQTEASAATEQTPPLQPNYPESAESGVEPVEEQSETSVPEIAEPAESVQPARTRRRKKRKPTQPAEQPPAASGDEPEIAIADTTEPAMESAEPDVAALEVAAEPPSAESAPAQQGPVPVASGQKQGRQSKGAVVLAVGLPGSGKSTWFKRRGVSPLSSDMVRHVLFDNPSEQRYQDLVFGTLRSLLRARLIARMPMNYVDATNLSPKERRHWIRMAKDFGYEVHAVYFDVPLEVCTERNRRRGRVVPEDVMQRMAGKLRPPTFDEGFSKIIVVRVKHKPGEAAEAPERQAIASPTSNDPVAGE